MIRIIIQLTTFLAFSLTQLVAQERKEVSLPMNFHEIQVEKGIEVKVRQGKANHAVVSSYRIDQVDLHVEKGKLIVSFRDEKNNEKDHKTKIDLVAKDLHSFRANSGATLNITSSFPSSEQLLLASSGSDIVYPQIHCDHLRIKSSSGSDVKAAVKVKKLSIETSSGSDVDVSGHSNRMEINASSASDVNALLLCAEDVKIKASSSSDVEVCVREKLEAKASSSADISYVVEEGYEHTITISQKANSGSSIEQIK